jgi:hypothetical protein
MLTPRQFIGRMILAATSTCTFVALGALYAQAHHLLH